VVDLGLGGEARLTRGPSHDVINSANRDKIFWSSLGRGCACQGYVPETTAWPT